MATESALIKRDLGAIRSEFPILQMQMNGKPLVYLDSASSAQKPRAVIDAMNAVMESGYANIHRGLYAISQDLTTQFEGVRSKIANFIGAASEKEIVFTRNTTEASNLVAQSWGRAHLNEGDEIIISEMEHHANIVPWQLLRDQIGVVIKVIPMRDDGTLDLDAFEDLLCEKTKLISVVHISNAIGTVNNISKIIELSRKFNPEIKVMIDGTQSAVHMPVNMRTLDADFFTFTGHKLYGPTGIGVLYGKYDVLESMLPYQGGGDMIEHVTFEKTTFKAPPFRFEAGTPAILEVIGLGAAVDMCVDITVETIAEHEAELTKYAYDALSTIDGLTLYGPSADKRAGIFSFTVDGTHPSDIGMILDQQGIAVRTGHHCAMPLMQRLGVDATVRASIGMYSTKQDIDALITGIKKAQELFA